MQISRLILNTFLWGLMLVLGSIISSSLGYTEELTDKELLKKELQRVEQLNKQGEALFLSGKYKKALSPLKQSLIIMAKTLGEQHPDTATGYNNIGETYRMMGNYTKTLEYHFKTLAIRKKVLGKQHPDTATSYNNIGLTYRAMGNHSKQLKYELKVLTILEKILGKQHPDTATSYNHIGSTYGDMGNHAKALEYHFKALAIREKVLGKQHSDTDTSYNNIGETYRVMGSYAKALKFHFKALSISEKVLGKQHPDTATSYNNIGITYDAMGNLTKALEYLLKGLAIQEKVLGKQHLDTALSYNNLGETYRARGHHSKVLDYHFKSLAIREKVLGKQHPDTAISYNNLGESYRDMGNYAKALEYHFKALAIREKVLDKQHPDTAGSYNNLGLTYRAMGNHAKALEYFLKALAIQKKVLDKQHPDTAGSYNNLGLTYRARGNYAKALRHHFKALTIMKKILGKQHPDTAISHNNIGSIYNDMGNHSEALEYHLKALTIMEKALGKQHPHTALSYNNIGSTYDRMRNYIKALEFYFKALSIAEKVLGKQHPNTATSYNNIGVTYSAMGNHAKAYQYAQKAFTTFILNRDNSFLVLSSQQKQHYLKANEPYIDGLLSHATHYHQDLVKNNKTKPASEVVEATLNHWLSYKGSILANSNLLEQIAKISQDPKVIEKALQIQQIRGMVSNLSKSIKDPKGKDKAKQQQLEKQLALITRLQQAIATADPRYAKERALQKVNSKDVATMLQADELYIDYAKTNAGYYVFTIDYQHQLSFTFLGEKDTAIIDKKIKAFNENIEKVKNLLTAGKSLSKDVNDKARRTLKKLYQVLIKNHLGDKIAKKSSLIISPDGALRLLPFEALYDAKNKDKPYLIQQKNIRYIASAKELLRLHRQEKTQGSSTQRGVLFANPDYDQHGLITPSKKKPANTKETPFNPALNRSRSNESIEGEFLPLLGTHTEVSHIFDILTEAQVETPYEGRQASSEQLFSIQNPKILHIATHGFFTADNPNPMLKSGIALAGANIKQDKQRQGIVLALDLGTLKLQGTELVVLSACETGKVDPNNTEGVSGLTKAFLQAGAKSVVMSLWKVNDDATEQLMTSFYQAGKEKQSYSQALKQSKLEMIDRHPYYWAGFVLNGL